MSNIFWRAGRITCAILIGAVAILAQPANPCDSIAGSWNWFNGRTVSINANGSVSDSAGGAGKWTFAGVVSSSGSKRLNFVLHWNTYNSDDHVTLGADGLTLTGNYGGRGSGASTRIGGCRSGSPAPASARARSMTYDQRVARAQGWMADQNWANAIAESRRAALMDPTRWEAHAVLGYALAKDNRFEEALNTLNRALKLAPPDKQTAVREMISEVNSDRDFQGRRQLGITQLQSGDFAAAAGAFYKLWRVDPGNSEPAFVSAKAWKVAGENDQARKVLEEIVREVSNKDDRERAQNLIIVDNARRRREIPDCKTAARILASVPAVNQTREWLMEDGYTKMCLGQDAIPDFSSLVALKDNFPADPNVVNVLAKLNADQARRARVQQLPAAAQAVVSAIQSLRGGWIDQADQNPLPFRQLRPDGRNWDIAPVKLPATFSATIDANNQCVLRISKDGSDSARGPKGMEYNWKAHEEGFLSSDEVTANRVFPNGEAGASLMLGGSGGGDAISTAFRKGTQVGEHREDLHERRFVLGPGLDPGAVQRLHQAMVYWHELCLDASVK